MINIINLIKNDYIYILAFFLLYVLISLQIGTRIINSHIDYDEGYNLQISQNLYTSGEYATYDSLFDPYITTGPTVLIPTSFFISKQYPLLPRIIPSLYTLLLIIIISRYLLISKLQKILYLILLNFIPLFFFFSAHVLGEIPAFTFFILSLVSISKRKYILGGIFIGLSLLTKTMFLLTIISIIYIIFADYLNQKKIKKAIEAIIDIIYGSLLIIAIWHLFILWQVQFDINSYQKILIDSFEIYHKKSVSNLGLIHGRLEMITWVFKIDAKIYILITLGIVFFVIKKYFRTSNLLVSVSSFYICLLVYFLLLGATNWYRHFFPAVLCLSIIIPYLIGDFIEKNKKKGILGIIIGAFVIIIFMAYNSDTVRYQYFHAQQKLQQNLIFEYEGYMPIWQKDTLLIHQMATKDFILKEMDSRKKISGIGWWNAPEISYLINRKIYRNPFAEDVEYLIFHIYGDTLAPQKTKKMKSIKSKKEFEKYGYSIVKKI